MQNDPWINEQIRTAFIHTGKLLIILEKSRKIPSQYLNDLSSFSKVNN